MAGIVGFGTCVPWLRLPRDVVAKEWGLPSLPGERAIAAADEDSLTLAVNASLLAVSVGRQPDAVFFGSTTPPYREKQSAATVAAVLDCGASVRAVDFTDSLRVATLGMRAGLDAIAGGTAGCVLVCAGDCRTGKPGSLEEQSYGDAGAAVVLGADDVLADVIATGTVSEEFHGTWRTSEQSFLHGFPGSFETKLGYVRVMTNAIGDVLRCAGIAASDVTAAVITAPNPRAALGVARAVGLDARRQLQDTLWVTLGDTGAAQPLLMLAAALERARAGDLILLACYGDGADALLLRVTDRISGHQVSQSVFSQIERKAPIVSYGRYAQARGLVRTDAETTEPSTPVALFRDRREILPLYGGRCPNCATVQFPIHRACIECGCRDGLEETKLGRRGTVFTFTTDHVGESEAGPVPHAVVDLEGGGRLYLQLADCTPEALSVDMPVDLTFRRYPGGLGLKSYFWKARPS
jgi:3-hydroxy-3-methylglutaryl CoA synthase